MMKNKKMRVMAIGFFACATFAMAQDAPATGGWRRVGDSSAPADTSSPQISQSAPSGPTAAPSTYPDPNVPDQQTSAPQQQPMQQQPMQQQPMQQQPMQQGPMQPQPNGYAQIPAQIAVPAGTYLTVRVNQRLSSDKNQVGDAFSATLTQPLVANGVVVAEPGQTIGGRVSQVEKSGRVSGLAKLGIELIDLTLVDGQQLPVNTMLVSRTANSSTGRDAGAIAGTTALGAAIGAGADWGRGAAIGAGAGAAAGIIGVLVTRGQPSVIYPEQILTFKLQAPLTISTERAPQAFRYVQPNEYSNQMAYGPGPGYAAPAPAPYAYGYPSPYYGYPYYYPYAGFSLFVGPGYYGRGYYGGRGFYGGFRGGFRR